MTITITTGELLSYEKACENWVKKNLEKDLFQHLLKGNQLEDCGRIMSSDVTEWLNGEIRNIDDYLLMNPIPKLIPEV